MSWHKEQFKNMEDYLENKKHKYTMVILHYSSCDVGPEVFIYDSDYEAVLHYLEDIRKEVKRHWENGTWWFGKFPKTYGLHTFDFDDVVEFYEQLYNYERG